MFVSGLKYLYDVKLIPHYSDVLLLPMHAALFRRNLQSELTDQCSMGWVQM